jgi:hypothetical protein
MRWKGCGADKCRCCSFRARDAQVEGRVSVWHAIGEMPWVGSFTCTVYGVGLHSWAGRVDTARSKV